jgi:hypothetical protein
VAIWLICSTAGRPLWLPGGAAKIMALARAGSRFGSHSHRCSEQARSGSTAARRPAVLACRFMIRGMVIDRTDKRLATLAPLQAFLEGTTAVEFALATCVGRQDKPQAPPGSVLAWNRLLLAARGTETCDADAK